MFIIYRIVNKVNKKSYVGFTTKTTEERWKEHLLSSKKGSMRALQCAIRKYGTESFSVEILEEGWDPKIGLVIREPHWISILKPEYNMTRGGEGVVGYVHTPEQNKLKSNRMKGKFNGGHIAYTEERRKEQSIRMMGHSVSEITRQRISEVKTGKTHSHGHTPEQNKSKSIRMTGKKRGHYRKWYCHDGI